MQHSDGVVCEFVRQRCTHEALFQPFYKRSNRTKGSKILRCFPHCCPNHAHRGFCGSSLHVRVEWPSSTTCDLRSPPPPPPAIHVLGRFRLSDTPPLPLGHVLQAATVFGAVQSDDTPNGEWIDSQMIYSWSKTNWLFEINSAARWFYGWESSTVKSQRLKDHVLDVYVFAATSHSPSATGPDVLRVVAATTSPSFQLISFRRATDDAMLALSATHHVRQQLQSGAEAGLSSRPPQHYVEEGRTLGVSGGPRPPIVRYHAVGHPTGHSPHTPSYPSAHPPARPLHHLHPPPAAHSAVPVTRPLSLPSLRPSLTPAPSTSVQTSAHNWTAPPLAPTISSTRPHTSLAPLHHAPPSIRAPLVAQSQPPPQTRPLLVRPTTLVPPNNEARPMTAWRPPPLAITRLSNPAPSVSSSSSSRGDRGRDSAAWEITNLLSLLAQIPLTDAFERVAWIHETYVQYTTEYANEAQVSEPKISADSEMSVRRALASLGLQSTTRKLPSRLLATLTELAMWLLWDPVTLRQLHGAARNATTMLADPTLVRRSFSRAVFFLHDHIGRFLDRRFQTTITDVLGECEALGLAVPREADAPPSPSLAMALGKSGERPMKGQEVFVAHVRELLVAEPVEHRRKRRRLSVLHKPVAASFQQVFNQRWACSLNDVHVHRSSLSQCSPQASLLTLLWFYRQFSVITLALDDEGHLDVRSIFALAKSPLFSRLVLDGTDRFVHAFPAGEATLATTVGRYTFGDYVGALDTDHVRLQLYAFASPASIEEVAIECVAADACVCYDVTLRPTLEKTLEAEVVVQSGALDVMALHRAGHNDARVVLQDMATWPLRQKLTAVGAWDETCRLQFVYHSA